MAGNEIEITETASEQEIRLIRKEIREIKGTLDLLDSFIKTIMDTQEVTTKALKKMYLEIESLKN